MNVLRYKSLRGQMLSSIIILIAIKSFESITQAVDIISPKVEEVTTSITSLSDNKDVILSKLEGACSVSQEISSSSEEIVASTV